MVNNEPSSNSMSGSRDLMHDSNFQVAGLVEVDVHVGLSYEVSSSRVQPKLNRVVPKVTGQKEGMFYLFIHVKKVPCRLSSMMSCLENYLILWGRVIKKIFLLIWLQVWGMAMVLWLVKRKLQFLVKG